MANRFKYEGQSIYLAGKPGDKVGITFQHTDERGRIRRVSLQINKAYFVGGKDETGQTIEDWVYERAQHSDLNNNRAATSADEHLVRSEIVEGEDPNHQSGFIN